MLFKWHKIGLLEFASLLAVLIWIFFRYQHTLNQLHPEWILMAVALGVFWCLRYNLYLPLSLLLLIAAILLHQWLVVLPSSVNWLSRKSQQNQQLCSTAGFSNESSKKILSVCN